jgi:hypothetical protein
MNPEIDKERERERGEGVEILKQMNKIMLICETMQEGNIYGLKFVGARSASRKVCVEIWIVRALVT